MLKVLEPVRRYDGRYYIPITVPDAASGGDKIAARVTSDAFRTIPEAIKFAMWLTDVANAAWKAEQEALDAGG